LRIYLDITDLLEFLCTAEVLHGVGNVTHQLILQLGGRPPPGSRLVGFHPIHGRAFCIDIAQVPRHILAEPKSLKSLFGLDGRHPVKSAAAIRNRHAGRPARQVFEHAKRALRLGLRTSGRAFGGRGGRWPAAPLVLHRDVRGFDIAAGDLVIVPGLNVWYPEHNRALGSHVRAQGGKLVVVVHDLGPATAAAYFPASYRAAFRDWMHSLFPYADLFVAVSNHTSREMAAIDPALRRDTPCIVNPSAHEFPLAGATTSNPLVDELIGRDYILHVGRIEPRKNLIGLVTVWGRLARELGPALPMLVLAGRMNYPDGSFDAAANSIGVATGHIRLLQDLSTAELARLYGGCRFAVYPSFFEGWGLPVGEAACFGKVTAASNAASIPEVVGDLAVYFDPHDLDAMAAVLRRLIADRDYLAGLEARLKSRFRPRSWADCASRLIEIASNEGQGRS
jgi:glycosyltransferase involved in cell wall biosynthesis